MTGASDFNPFELAEVGTRYRTRLKKYIRVW
jgi:hypothetical protein